MINYLADILSKITKQIPSIAGQASNVTPVSELPTTLAKSPSQAITLPKPVNPVNIPQPKVPVTIPKPIIQPTIPTPQVPVQLPTPASVVPISTPLAKLPPKLPKKEVTSWTEIKTILTFGKDILQGTIRSGGAIGTTLLQPLTGMDELVIDPQSPKIQQIVQRVLFGNEPVKALAPQIADTEIALKQLGFDKSALPIAFAGVSALTALDFMGWGGERATLKAIAKSQDAFQIAKILKKIGVTDDIIPSVAKGFANMTDEKQIKVVLDKISEIQKATKIAQNVKGMAKGSGEVVEDMITKEAKPIVSDVIAPKVETKVPELSDIFAKEPPTIEGFVQQLKGAATKFKTNWSDEYTPVKNLVDTFEQMTGKKILPNDNPYVLIRNFAGWGGKVDNLTNELGTILRESKIDQATINNYLGAQRMLERAERGFQNPLDFTHEGVLQRLKELKEKLGPEQFANLEQTAAKIYEYGDELLQMLKRGGIIDEESFKLIKSQNQRWIPFEVVEYLRGISDDAVIKGTKSFSVASQDVLKAISGTQKTIALPLETLLKRTYDTVKLVERNKIANKLIDMRKLAPSALGELIIPLRVETNVVRRSQIYKQLKDLKSQLLPTIREMKKNTKLDKAIVSKLNNIDYAIQRLRVKLTKEMNAFFNPGKKTVKIFDPSTKVKTIPLALDQQARYIQQNFSSYKKFQKSTYLIKELESGKLEALGFKSRKAFYEAAKHPFSRTGETMIEAVSKENVQKLVQIQKDIEKLIEKGEFVDIQKRGLEDALNYVKKLAENINEERAALRAEAKGLQDIKVLPEGYAKVARFKNGIMEEYAIPKEVADAFTGANQQSSNFANKLLQWFSQAFRYGTTSWNAAFFVPNAFRDYHSAVVNAKYGFNPVDYIKGFFSVIKKDEYYKAWKEYGGAFSTRMDVFRGQPVQKTLKNITEGTAKKVIKTIVNPIRLLHTVGQIVEETPRVGVFRKTLKKGTQISEAVLESRQATVDFAKKGVRMQIANALIPYLNARLQGSLNLVRVLKERPIKAGTTIAYTVATPTVLAYLWNRKQPGWDEIPQWEKDNNWIIVTGQYKNSDGQMAPSYIKVPKGDVGRIFGNPLESSMQFVDKKDSKHLDQIALEMFSDLSPVPFEREGKFSGTEIVSSLAPPLPKTAAEIGVNKSLYTRQPIVSEFKSKASPEFQYGPTTTETAKLLAKALNISASKLEYGVKGIFGQAPIHVFQGSDYVLRKMGEVPQSELTKTEKLMHTPVISRFYGGYGGAKPAQDLEKLSDLEREAADRAIKEQMKAKEIITSFRDQTKTPEQRKKLIEESKKNGTLNENVEDKIKDIIQDEQRGITYFDERVKTLPPKERARYIIDKFKSLPSPESRKKFVEEITNKKILTAEVVQQMKAILQ